VAGPSDRGVTADDERRRLAFEQLFADHLRIVSAYVRRRATAEVADDVVAETFLVAWRRLEDVPPEPKGWLLAVARRVLANQRRATARRAALTAHAASAMSPKADAGEGDARVLRALAKLSERDRDLLLLSAWDGLTAAEIAAAVGCSRAAAKVRLHRARRRLQRQLAELDTVGATLTTLEVTR
jgi:RNA polymerase sigma-70 factor (ECF subfamily)